MQRIHPGLLALSVTAFAIGMAEFIVVGILPEIATALTIDLPRAGNLVGLYALATAVGTPLLVMAISGFPQTGADSPDPYVSGRKPAFGTGEQLPSFSYRATDNRRRAWQFFRHRCDGSGQNCPCRESR